MWNCRGLGNQLAVQELVDLVQAKGPAVVFLAETLADEARLDYVKDRIRFDKKFFVQRENRGGGLVLYWKNDIEVEVESSSLSHIDTVINKNSGKAWRFTDFYGNPETHRRSESWDLLRRLHGRNSLPWLCVGDFNEIVKQSEKFRGRLRPQNQMQMFRDALDECELMDLGFKGFPFTWSKHYKDGFLIWERLDKAIASHDWFVDFSGTRVTHVNSTTSDHKLLWIDLVDLDFQQKKKVFRFEEVWLSDKGCGETIENVWLATYEETKDTRVTRKIEACGVELTRWSHNNFRNIRRDLEKKRKELAQVERVVVQGGGLDKLWLIKKEVNALMDKEEWLWRQRSRTLYLKDGDHNTKFFHRCATQRKQKNSISDIRNHSNVWCTDRDQITEAFLKYYSKLFTSSKPDPLTTELESIP